MSRWERIRDRAGVPLVLRGDERLLAPEDEEGLSRTLAAITRAGSRATVPGIDDARTEPLGANDDQIPVSLDKMSRVLSVDAIDGLIRVQPGALWAEVEGAAEQAGLEACVALGRNARQSEAPTRVIDLLMRRCSILLANPFSERAAWLRDLRLVTPGGEVVSSPYAPRRSTGPDLRIATASLGSAWGIPSELTIMASPQAAREFAVWTLPKLGAGIEALRALVRQGPEASFLAELELTGKRSAKPVLHVQWRATGHRSLPQIDSLARAGGTRSAKAADINPDTSRLLFKARWSELDEAWRQSLAKALRAKAPPSGLRLANPSAQGVEIELFGLSDPSAAAAHIPTRAQAASAQVAELRRALLAPSTPAKAGDA